MPGRGDGSRERRHLVPSHAVAVVIPAYQAAATVASVVARTRRAVPAATVYVVDDGSTDATGEAGRGTGAEVLAHPRNGGKGEALRTGMARGLRGRKSEGEGKKE